MAEHNFKKWFVDEVLLRVEAINEELQELRRFKHNAINCKSQVANVCYNCGGIEIAVNRWCGTTYQYCLCCEVLLCKNCRTVELPDSEDGIARYACPNCSGINIEMNCSRGKDYPLFWQS